MAFTIGICMGRGHYTDYNNRFAEMGMALCRREGQKKYARALVGPPGFEPGTNRL
jgi:hypothetical protein